MAVCKNIQNVFNLTNKQQRNKHTHTHTPHPHTYHTHTQQKPLSVQSMRKEDPTCHFRYILRRSNVYIFDNTLATIYRIVQSFAGISHRKKRFSGVAKGCDLERFVIYEFYIYVNHLCKLRTLIKVFTAQWLKKLRAYRYWLPKCHVKIYEIKKRSISFHFTFSKRGILHVCL